MLLNKYDLQKTFFYGLISGLFLAIFLKIVELITSYKVYTLLLNIDYIPYINTFDFPEVIEVGFHLIVSIALTIFLYLLIVYRKVSTRKRIIVLCTFVCFFIGLMLFPTTMLSDRTPQFTSIPSFSYWIVGHVIYGYIIGVLFARHLAPK